MRRRRGGQIAKNWPKSPGRVSSNLWEPWRPKLKQISMNPPYAQKLPTVGSWNDFDEIGSWFLHMDTSQNHWESGSDVTFHLAVPWGAVTIKSLPHKLRNINCTHHLMKHNFQLLLNLGCQSSLKMKKSWMCQCQAGCVNELRDGQSLNQTFSLTFQTESLNSRT